MTTRMVLMSASRRAARPADRPPQPNPCYEGRNRPRCPRPTSRSQLFYGRVTQHQVLDAVVAAEVDLRLGIVARALHRDDRAKAVGVVGDLVARGQRRDPPVPWGTHAGPRSQALRGGRGRGALVAAPLDQVRGDLGKE